MTSVVQSQGTATLSAEERRLLGMITSVVNDTRLKDGKQGVSDGVTRLSNWRRTPLGLGCCIVR